MKHVILAVALWLGSTSAVLCHTLQITGMTIRVDASGTSVSVVAHAPLFGGEEPSAAFAKRVKLRLEGVPFQPQQISLSRDSRFDTVTWTAWTGASAASVSVDAPVFPDRPEDTTVVLVYREGKAIDKTALNPAHPSAVVGESSWAVVRRFVAMGWSHIFSGPDHILFVLGLILAGGTLRSLASVISAFTVAHSITLSMTVLGMASLPSAVVEPVIALSVIAAGVGSVKTAPAKAELCAWLAFGFGLFHGFGFADALVGAGLPRHAAGTSLFAFNAGVEAGQLAILSAVVPLLSALRVRGPEIASRLSRCAGGGIAAAGAFWLAQRVLSAG